MKTLKLFFHFHTLALLGCFVLFMTSCQDELEKNDLSPSTALAPEETISAEVQQALQAVLDNPSSSLSNARTAQKADFTYEVTVNVFTLDSRAGGKEDKRGELIEQRKGTLVLTEVSNSRPGSDARNFSGTFTYADPTTGELVKQRAIALAFNRDAYLFLARPSGGFDSFPSFTLGESFATPSGRSVFSRDEQGRPVLLTTDATLVKPKTPEPAVASTTYVYDLSATIQERIVTFDTIDSPLGPIAISNSRLDTVVQLVGKLEVVVREEAGSRISGRYNFVASTSSGRNISTEVTGTFSDENTLLLNIGILDLGLPEPGVSEISITSLPIQAGSDFVLPGLGRDETGNFLDGGVTFEGELTDIIVVEEPS